MNKQACLNSLVALSVGDSYGENILKILPPREAGYYNAGNVAGERQDTNIFRWPWSDDTAMAIGIVRCLFQKGCIDQIPLAKEFSWNFRVDPQRGYGRGTVALLQTFQTDAENWELYSKTSFGNTGSYGNGAAMRSAPIGPFFGTDYTLIAEEAFKSAVVTHYQNDAVAGAIAVAIAAAVAANRPPDEYWDTILTCTPEGPVRDRIKAVSTIPVWTNNGEISGLVGNGSKVSALDTVPYAVWCAYQGLMNRDFAQTMLNAVWVGGDTDTYCAMIGGIIGNVVHPPQEWLDRTERLPVDLAA